MSIGQMLREKKNVLVALVAAVVILAPIVYSLFDFVLAGDPQSSRPFLEMPDPKYKECVRDTEYMRFHHWELLREIRDDAVRDRKRGDLRLSECRKCHENRDQFCNKCHDAVNLKPDCWGCHYYPDSPEEIPETNIRHGG